LDVHVARTKLPDRFHDKSDYNVSFDKELDAFQKYTFDYLIEGNVVKVERPNSFKQVGKKPFTDDGSKTKTKHQKLVDFRAFMQESRLPGTEDEQEEEIKKLEEKLTREEEEQKISFTLSNPEDIEEKRKYVYEEFKKLPKNLLENPFFQWDNSESKLCERSQNSEPFSELQ
jgi:hypothetical protein